MRYYAGVSGGHAALFTEHGEFVEICTTHKLRDLPMLHVYADDETMFYNGKNYSVMSKHRWMAKFKVKDRYEIIAKVIHLIPDIKHKLTNSQAKSESILICLTGMGSLNKYL